MDTAACILYHRKATEKKPVMVAARGLESGGTEFVFTVNSFALSFTTRE